MNIEFKKISYTPKPINIHLDNASFLSEGESVNLVGNIERVDSNLVKFSGSFEAILNLICIVSGDEFVKNINENLVLYFSDGIWKAQSQAHIDSLDVIEFFDGLVDFVFVIESEIEIIRLDYNVKE